MQSRNIDAAFVCEFNSLVVAARKHAAEASEQSVRGAAAIDFAMRLKDMVVSNPEGSDTMTVRDIAPKGKIYQVTSHRLDPAAIVHRDAENWVVQTVDKTEQKIQLQYDLEAETWACVWQQTISTSKSVLPQMQRVGSTTQTILAGGAKVQIMEVSPESDSGAPVSAVVLPDKNTQVAFLRNGSAVIR